MRRTQAHAHVRTRTHAHPCRPQDQPGVLAGTQQHGRRGPVAEADAATTCPGPQPRRAQPWLRRAARGRRRGGAGGTGRVPRLGRGSCSHPGTGRKERGRPRSCRKLGALHTPLLGCATPLDPGSGRMPCVGQGQGCTRRWCLGRAAGGMGLLALPPLPFSYPRPRRTSPAAPPPLHLPPWTPPPLPLLGLGVGLGLGLGAPVLCRSRRSRRRSRAWRRCWAT